MIQSLFLVKKAKLLQVQSEYIRSQEFMLHVEILCLGCWVSWIENKIYFIFWVQSIEDFIYWKVGVRKIEMSQWLCYDHDSRDPMFRWHVMK